MPTKSARARAPRAESKSATVPPASLLGDHDLHLFNEGTHVNLHAKLGSHLMTHEGVAGAYFAVWAPEAERVSVIGDFNGWNNDAAPLQSRASSGIWEGFLPGVTQGACYKYHIVSGHRGYVVDKADPFAVFAEVAPRTGSIVWDLDYSWGDAEWMASRAGKQSLTAPMSIYEVHLGSWRRVPEDGNRSLSYREIAPQLAAYAADLGFTHVELLPIMEHPFYGSWGYQTTGYFAPTSRYGSPQDFMYLVDTLHQHGIGVILDWVPSHFPSDEHALGFFDGTHLFEHADARIGFHPDWNSYIFNYGRNEVRSFLLSSALYWIGIYHADGLRVDAVASMLYRDYSRKPGEWIPNVHGGRENIEAIELLRRVNADVYAQHPEVQTIAEESTSWPMVSRPVYVGGLGFGFKWDMGWMHDALQYFARDPVHRKFHHNELTFRTLYAFTENFVLPLSHDEVVYGKRSLLNKMPGDTWQQFANLRLLLGFMYGQGGKKLLFMGGEFGQWREWDHDTSLDWDLLERGQHSGMQQWVRDLNTCYRSETALHELDCAPGGFNWISCNDAEQSVLVFARTGHAPNDVVIAACNFTPVSRIGYRIGVPRAGYWRELLNSDARIYGGSGQGNLGSVRADHVPFHNQPRSINVTLPPLAIIFFKAPSTATD